MKKLLVGLLGGLSLGLLFAPKKGKDLRKELAKSDEKIHDFAKEFLVAGKDASEEVKKLLDSKEVKEMLSRGKESFDDLLKQGDSLSQKGKKEFEKIVKSLQKQDFSSLKKVLSSFSKKS